MLKMEKSTTFDLLVCSSKKSYKNRKEARKASKEIKRLLKCHQRPYRCPICSSYHLRTVKQERVEEVHVRKT